MIVSADFLLVIYMVAGRILIGPEAQGVFTLLTVVIFLISVAIMGIGIIGEYVGRMYQNTSRRNRFVIREIIEQKKKK